MEQVSYQRDAQGVYHLEGELGFQSVPVLQKEIKQDIDFSSSLSIDFSAVTQANSAILALMIEWMREVKQNNGRIVYLNVPDNVLAVASAYGIDQDLPTSS